MSNAAVLEVVQRFAKTVGIPSPSAAVANTTDDVQQIVELLNQEGRSLASRHDWQALTFETTFLTVATESQGTLDSIIGAGQALKKITNSTLFNRSTKLFVDGPLSPRIWQAYKGLTLVGPFPQYRIRGNQLIFNPVPTAGQSVYFEYVSKSWCVDAGGSPYRQNVDEDTDVLLLDSDLILAGLEWRYLRKKGLSYAEEFQSYEYLVKEAIGNDGMKPRLRMDDYPETIRPGTLVPSGSWPL